MKAKNEHVVIDENRFWTILAAILIIGFSIKLVRLDFPPNHYFDEVYHGYTAGLYLQNHPDSYSLYAKNPEGKAVEWTHPPTAKLLMTVPMFIWGNNSFAWRFSSVVFGTLLVLFAALVALELFESRFIALSTAFMLSIEGLVFTQARIAMNDSHLVSFIFMCFYFYLRWRKDQDETKYILLAGLGLGLAVSSKWSALFVYFAIAAERLVSWWKSDSLFPGFKELGQLVVGFLVIPPPSINQRNPNITTIVPLWCANCRTRMGKPHNSINRR